MKQSLSPCSEPFSQPTLRDNPPIGAVSTLILISPHKHVLGIHQEALGYAFPVTFSYHTYLKP